MGGLTTPSRSKELKRGMKTGKLISATVWDAPDLFANRDDKIFTSSLFVAAMYVSPWPNLASLIISGSRESPEMHILIVQLHILLYLYQVLR